MCDIISKDLQNVLCVLGWQFQVQGKFVIAPLRWLFRLPLLRTSPVSAVISPLAWHSPSFDWNIVVSWDFPRSSYSRLVKLLIKEELVTKALSYHMLSKSKFSEAMTTCTFGFICKLVCNLPIPHNNWSEIQLIKKQNSGKAQLPSPTPWLMGVLLMRMLMF